MSKTVEEISQHDALIYVMVIVSAADTNMTDRELKKIGDVVQTLPVFTGFNKDGLVAAAKACGEILQGGDGLDAVLDLITRTLPPRLYDTAYALAVEVAAADLFVEQEELRLLQMVSDRLNLDKLTVAAIERGARARYRMPD